MEPQDGKQSLDSLSLKPAHFSSEPTALQENSPMEEGPLSLKTDLQAASKVIQKPQ